MAARIESDLREAQRRRELDEEEVTDSEWECHALHLAERQAGGHPPWLGSKDG